MTNNLIGTKEAAEIIGVSKHQVRCMIRAGLFEHVERLSDKSTSHYRLELEEVERAKHIYRKLRFEKKRRGTRCLYERAETAK